MSRSATSAPAAAAPPESVADVYRRACQVADVLGRMTFAERLRAYRSRVFSPRELANAAAWLPDEMPMLYGEFEWIAHDLE